MRLPNHLLATSLTALLLAACQTAHAEPAAAEKKPAAPAKDDILTRATPATDATAPEPDLAAAGFAPLFNGKDLSGWKRVNGTASYTVDNGEIVGQCVHGSPNTFLRTERDDFKDFVLAFDMKFEVDGNSGMQFRSAQVKPEDTFKAWSKTADGRVYGYQCEMDPSKRAWTCGIMEEGRRGWLQNLNGPHREAARAALKAHDWNRVVIKAEGHHLQTWLNGVPVSDYVDNAPEARDSGFFGLQVHAGKEGTIRWRNIRILELNK